MGNHRRWLISGLLLLLPLIIYSNTIFSRFGFRDDYSILRETSEEPGKIIKLCASHARPIYGWMLENFFSRMDEIDDLWVARALGALCIGGLSILIFLALTRLRWGTAPSTLLAALMAMLPAAQVDVSWAICWPHVVAGMCGIGGFLVSDRGGILRRIGGGVLVMAGTLIYQPNALFYVVPVAAGLFIYRHEPIRWRFRWAFVHILVVGAALASAFLLVQGLYAAKLIHLHPLVTIETDILSKLDFYIHKPLLNALALFVLNDMRERWSLIYGVFAAAVSLTILAGGWGELRRGGWREGAFWAASLFVLFIVSSAPVLIAAQRWPTYRTIYPLTGVCLIFLVLGLHHLNEYFNKKTAWLVPAAFAAMLTVAAPLASWHAYTLFALPQQQELALIEEGVKRLKPVYPCTVLVIWPDPEHSPASAFYSDEFGTLSTNSDWTPKEMLKLILREKFPNLRDRIKRLTVVCGHRLPLKPKYDVIIDMRQLRASKEVVAADGFLLF